VAGAVPLGDLGVQPAFVAGQRVGGVRAADHDRRAERQCGVPIQGEH